jgi:hypothetical protein
MANYSPSKEDAKRILESRKVITTPGKHRLQVVSCNRYEKNGRTRMIISLKAMNGYQASQAREAFKAGNYLLAVNQQMTTNARISQDGEQIDYVPESGEFIDVFVDNVLVSDGEGGKTEALLVVSHREVPVEKDHANFSLDEEDEEITEPADEQVV